MSSGRRKSSEDGRCRWLPQPPNPPRFADVADLDFVDAGFFEEEEAAPAKRVCRAEGRDTEVCRRGETQSSRSMQEELPTPPLAFKFIRESDSAVYVFVWDGESQVWSRSDNPDVIVRRAAARTEDPAQPGKFKDPRAAWYVTTLADTSQRLGWHEPQPPRQSDEDLGAPPEECRGSHRRTAAESSSSDCPPPGAWVSREGEKSHRYELEYLRETAALCEEYETQDRLRQWDSMLERLSRVVNSYRPKTDHGSDERCAPAKFGTFFDLGCGAGPISRRVVLLLLAAQRLVAVDLDPSMVAHTSVAVRALAAGNRRVFGSSPSSTDSEDPAVPSGSAASADTEHFRIPRPPESISVRVADLAALTKDSIYPEHSWRAGSGGKTSSGSEALPSVVWSSFCTAYFHTPGVAAVLRHWADALLGAGGFMCLVEIQGLFSAHSISSAKRDEGSDVIRDAQQRLFRRADQRLLERLSNDVLAGTKLERIVEEELGDVLELVDASEWSDGELAFEGKGGEACLEQWQKRLQRPGIVSAVGDLRGSSEPGDSKEAKSFSEIFLECLKSEDHTMVRKVNMVILRKKGNDS